MENFIFEIYGLDGYSIIILVWRLFNELIITRSSPSTSETPPQYSTVPHCYYQQHYYPSYQTYYGNTSDYASAWWLAYQQPSGGSNVFYGQYIDNSYCYTDQQAPAVDASTSNVSSCLCDFISSRLCAFSWLTHWKCIESILMTYFEDVYALLSAIFS